eukprot:1322417-Rhodomonas_salina.2
MYVFVDAVVDVRSADVADDEEGAGSDVVGDEEVAGSGAMMCVEVVGDDVRSSDVAGNAAVAG